MISRVGNRSPIPENPFACSFRSWRTLIAGAFLLVLINSARSQQPLILHLGNGDRVSGQLLGEDAVRLTLSNSILGRFTIPASAVARRETVSVAPPAPVTNAPGLPPTIQKRLNDLQGIYAAGSLSAEEFQRQRTALMEPIRPPGPKYWTAELFAGLDLLFSEKDRQLYTGRAKVNYVRPGLRSYFDYLFTYGYTDSELSANRMDGSSKTDVDLTKLTYTYGLFGAGYDEIRLIDWRYEVGPGLGYHLVKQTNFVLRVEGGFHYQVQNFQGGRDDHTFSQRLAQDLRWNLGPHFTFDERLEYFPDLANLNDFKLRMEANLRYWLQSNLSLNLTVIDIYDTRHASGVDGNDLQIRSSIGIRF